jgi:hypothetical protein
MDFKNNLINNYAKGRIDREEIEDIFDFFMNKLELGLYYHSSLEIDLYSNSKTVVQDYDYCLIIIIYFIFFNLAISA